MAGRWRQVPARRAQALYMRRCAECREYVRRAGTSGTAQASFCEVADARDADARGKRAAQSACAEKARMRLEKGAHARVRFSFRFSRPSFTATMRRGTVVPCLLRHRHHWQVQKVRGRMCVVSGVATLPPHSPVTVGTVGSRLNRPGVLPRGGVGDRGEAAAATGDAAWHMIVCRLIQAESRHREYAAPAHTRRR